MSFGAPLTALADEVVAVRPAARVAPAQELAGLRRVRTVGGCLGLGAIVAMPVRDEAGYLPRSLAALGESLRALDEPAGVALLVNNTRDASADVACAFGECTGLPVFCFEVALAPAIADAGHARRLALDLAASVAARDAVLLTTDADTVVDRDWARRLVATVRGGAALAYGAIEADPEEFTGLPGPVREMERLEAGLFAAQARLWRQLAPGTSQALGVRAGGASLALDARAYRRAGGMPPVPCGEDRAMVRALLARRQAVAFAEGAVARASCRVGDATPGGMAATLARRAAGERTCDSDLLPTATFALGALAFAHLAGLGRGDPAVVEDRLGLGRGDLRPRRGDHEARWRRLAAHMARHRPMVLDEACAELGRARQLIAALEGAGPAHTVRDVADVVVLLGALDPERREAAHG